MKWPSFLLLGLLPLAAAAQQTWVTDAAGLSPQVRTLVGDSIVGETKENGGMNPRFGFLTGVAVTNGAIYVADGNKDCIFRLDPTTGAISLLAGGTSGFADGVGPAARFNVPYGLAADGRGHLYVADCGNHRIRRIDLATAAVTTLAGSGQRGFSNGPGATAQFNRPSWVAADSLGNVYVTESLLPHIRQVEAGTGVVRKLAGGRRGFADGTGETARFSSLEGLALDGRGSLYAADYANCLVRRVELATGVVTTLAGDGRRGLQDGPGPVARFNQPMGLAVSGRALFLTDRNNNRVCQLDLPGGAVRTLAGSGTKGFDDGPGMLAEFIGPVGIAAAGNGTVYVIDVNYRVRVIR